MSLNDQIKKDLIDFQLNSHFIYNTLNNIYASAVIKPEIVLEAVQSLANLFRYTSQEVDREFISIKTEMSYIKSFIFLEKLRLKNPGNIILIEEIEEDVLIPPMILIPFVENAFKHGDANDTNNPIFLKIEVKDRIVHFSQSNKIVIKQKDNKSGIRLESIISILKQNYANRWNLSIKKDLIYEVDLTIIAKT